MDSANQLVVEKTVAQTEKALVEQWLGLDSRSIVGGLFEQIHPFHQ